MRIRYLHYFLVVAEEQSFSRAAARVHIEPSPLSRAIKELELQLGVQLLHRVKGRIRLTWPGEVFRDEARRVIDLMENAKTRAHSAAKGFRGRIRIGLADRLAQPHLTQLLECCRKEEPGTEIRVTEMPVSEMLLALHHDQIDVGFTVDGSCMPDYVKEPVWAERPVVAIPSHHPLLAYDKIPITEILRYPLILCHPQQCRGGYNTACRLFSLSNSVLAPTVAEYVTGHEPMIMLVAAGYGVGIGLESQVALYNNPDVIARMIDGDIPETFTYIVTTERIRSAELERFIIRARTTGNMFGMPQNIDTATLP